MTDGFSREIAIRALASPDEERLLAALSDVQNRGELAALELGYADAVAKHLGSKSSAVVAAAAAALGGMGSAGAKYSDFVATVLDSDAPKVQTAAATALGAFGASALEHGDKIAAVVGSATQDSVKLAAIQALGKIGAEGKADFLAGLLGEKSPDVQAAACVALGGLGSTGLKKAGDIAKKLSGADTKCAACNALSTLGGEAVAPNVEAIVKNCLPAEDMLTRQEALAALGKAPEAALKATSSISGLLTNGSPAVRAAATLCLGNMGEKAAEQAPAVTKLLADENEDETWIPLQVGGGSTREPMAMRKPKCAALVALGAMKAAAYINDIVGLLGDADWEVRFCAVEALGVIGEPAKEVAGKVADLMDDDTYPVRAKACFAIGQLKADDQADKLSEMLADKGQVVRAEAVAALGKMGEAGNQYTGDMAKLLSDISQNVRSAACGALAELGESGRPYASVVAKLLSDPDYNVCADACTALSKMGAYGAAFAEDVASLLTSPYPPLRAAAASALGRMGEEAIDFHGALKALGDDPDAAVVKAASSAAAALTAADA